MSDGIGNWWSGARRWIQTPVIGRAQPKLGLALGGGFARGIAHVGVLRVFEQAKIPLHFISGVSAGSIVASAFASGSTADEIESVARKMRFSDVARWRLSTRGLVGSDPMTQFLARVLKVFEFEKMKIPLAVVASDLNAGAPAVFKDRGDVVLPIRASCSYPGLFQPVRYMNHCLVDGMISMDVPAAPLRRMGATHVISVALPLPTETVDPQNMLSVVTRCFQIMTARTESQWRRHSNLVITPDVKEIAWNSFESAGALVQAGERAARQVLPQILRWFGEPPKEGGEATAVA
ncbi:MAG TPA: patatin-like phospholipase family protein [Bryobacteraceae bacterium]|nr:patatin-like phospholipase family protein [Bryobacteraceae bacterium]